MIDSESLSSMTDRYCRQILTVNIKPQELLDTRQCLSHRNRCSELNVDFFSCYHNTPPIENMIKFRYEPTNERTRRF